MNEGPGKLEVHVVGTPIQVVCPFPAPACPWHVGGCKPVITNRLYYKREVKQKAWVFTLSFKYWQQIYKNLKPSVSQTTSTGRKLVCHFLWRLVKFTVFIRLCDRPFPLIICSSLTSQPVLLFFPLGALWPNCSLAEFPIIRCFLISFFWSYPFGLLVSFPLGLPLTTTKTKALVFQSAMKLF